MSHPATLPNRPRIVLLRHGETQWNRKSRYQGQHDSPLGLTGIQQIRAVAHTVRPHLGNLEDYHLWSSPLPRTRQSISILSEELGLSYDDVSFDDRLMERSYGRWEGLTIDEIATTYPQDVEAQQADRWNFAIPGGESFAQVALRLQDWLDTLPTDKPVIVMAHGGSGRVLRGLCIGLTPQQIFASDEPQTTAFLIENETCQTLPADPEQLEKFGCSGAGLGVRI